MTKPAKFLFDEDFAPGGGKPTITVVEAERRRADAESQAYRQGFAAGQAQAQGEIIQRIANGLAVMADGSSVTTIEGLAPDGAPLHPMQEAFRDNHGLQCGFCTPGMIMTAVDLVHRKGHDLDDHTIREELEGNLCRCTGYQNIVASIAAGARAMAKSDLA